MATGFRRIDSLKALSHVVSNVPSIGKYRSERGNEVLKALTTKGAPTFQRGITFNTLMDKFCVHFAAVDQIAEEQVLSLHTQSYNAFISHSWRTSRWKKCAALMYFYSMAPAAACSLAVGIFAFLLQIFNVLPTFGQSFLFIDSYHPDATAASATWCKLFGGITFFGMLLFWDQVYSSIELVQGTRSMYFLDRLCICQTDPEQKQMGINYIGNYLRNSQHMVVLWAPEYFTRLWCCFELAVFLHMYTEKQTEEARTRISNASNASKMSFYFKGSAVGFSVVPVEYGVLSLYMAVWYYFLVLSMHVFPLIPSELVRRNWQYTSALSLIVALFFLSRFLREFMQNRRELKKQIGEFSVAKADVFAPEDREVIEQVILSLYSKAEDCSDGIPRFEDMVHTRMADSVQKMMGLITHPPWRLTMVLVIFMVLHYLDMIAQKILIGPDSPYFNLRYEICVKNAAYDFASTCATHTALMFTFTLGAFGKNLQRRSMIILFDICFALIAGLFAYFTVIDIPTYFMDLSITSSALSNVAWGLVTALGPSLSECFVPAIVRRCKKKESREDLKPSPVVPVEVGKPLLDANPVFGQTHQRAADTFGTGFVMDLPGSIDEQPR
jgi:hypothetical protein